MSIMIYKCNEDAVIPKYATRFSSCFDLHACLTSGDYIKGKSEDNADLNILVVDKKIQIPAKSRVLIPTGLKFNIPPCCSVRLHPRSGMAYKNGIMLVNCEGVIDEDYCEQVFAAVYNCTSNPVDIICGDRICQAEVVRDQRYEPIETTIEPIQRTDRVGGFGSTGK